MKRILSWSILIGFAVAQMAIIAPKFITSGSETMYMAVVGPMTGPDAERGKAMVDGATLMIDTLEKSGELGDRDIQLIIKDDKSDPQTAMEHAAALAQDEQVLAVLGHLSDEISRATAPIYAAGGLPIVSGSSGLPLVAAENEWYFRVGLTTVQQGTFLANYLARVMQEDTLQIITAQDEYSQSLTVAVEDELWFLKRLGTARVEISKKWSFDAAAEGEHQLDEIIDELSKTYTGGPLLVSVPSNNAADVIQRIRDNPRLRFGKPLPYKIIGPDSLGRPELLTSLSTLNRETARPGYYTEGMLAVAPFLEDVANQKALDFREEFQTRHSQAPSVIAAGFHDAATVVAQAMMKLVANPDDVKAARAEIRDHLMKFDVPDKAVSGVTGGIYFDRDGNAIKTVPIGVYRDRRLVSPPTQLSAVRDIETLGTSDIYQIAGNYFTPTRIVHTGVRVNEIKDIDLANRRAFIDFNIWFRYPDAFDMSAIEFPNAVEPLELGPPLDEASEPGQYYRLHRVKGLFHTGAVAKDERFGERVLGVQVRHRDLNRERLILVPDLVGMEQGQGISLTERVENITLLGENHDWAVKQASIFLDEEPIAMMGNPNFAGKEIDGYSRFNFGVWLKPTNFSIRDFIAPSVALQMFLICGTIAGMLGIAAHRFSKEHFVRWLWFPVVGISFAMLISGEALFVSLLTKDEGNPAMAETVIMIVHILWWILPAWLINSFVEQFIWAPLENRTKRQIPRVVRFFSASTVYILSVLAITAFVFDQKVTSLLATSGVLAMIIGLALQMNLSNIFSGIAINIERPFRIGDWIRVGDYEPGKVVGITWRTTRMETVDQNIICVPNSMASDSSLENLSYPSEIYRSQLMVHVDPGAKPEWVEKILYDAILSSPEVLKEPFPIVQFQGVKEWSAVYALRFFSKDYEASIVNEANVWRDVIRNLRYAGFESVIHDEFTLFHLSEAAKKSDDMAPLLIGDVEVFEPFGKEHREHLCRKMARHRIEPDRPIIKQGDAGNSLFIVAEGALSVEITLKDGEKVEVGRLGPGDFFGEMALLTGEDRGATVTTVTQSQVYEIAKADIEPIIKAFPDIADDLSQILTRRTLENLRIKNEHFASLDEEKSLATNILSKISRFFDITPGKAFPKSAAGQ